MTPTTQLTLRIARDVLGLEATQDSNGQVYIPRDCYVARGIGNWSKKFSLKDPAVIMQMEEWIIEKCGDIFRNKNGLKHAISASGYGFFKAEELGEALARLCLAILRGEK